VFLIYGGCWHVPVCLVSFTTCRRIVTWRHAVLMSTGVTETWFSRSSLSFYPQRYIMCYQCCRGKPQVHTFWPAIVLEPLAFTYIGHICSLNIQTRLQTHRFNHHNQSIFYQSIRRLNTVDTYMFDNSSQELGVPLINVICFLRFLTRFVSTLISSSDSLEYYDCFH